MTRRISYSKLLQLYLAADCVCLFRQYHVQFHSAFPEPISFGPLFSPETRYGCTNLVSNNFCLTLQMTVLITVLDQKWLINIDSKRNPVFIFKQRSSLVLY